MPRPCTRCRRSPLWAILRVRLAGCGLGLSIGWCEQCHIGRTSRTPSRFGCDEGRRGNREIIPTRRIPARKVELSLPCQATVSTASSCLSRKRFASSPPVRSAPSTRCWWTPYTMRTRRRSVRASVGAEQTKPEVPGSYSLPVNAMVETGAVAAAAQTQHTAYAASRSLITPSDTARGLSMAGEVTTWRYSARSAR
jgi:hypothetical protein